MIKAITIIGKIIGFPFLFVLAYLIYATLVGLLFSLISWDIHVLLDLWQFWKPMEDIDVGRIFCWIMALLGMVLLYSEGFDEQT